MSPDNAKERFKFTYNEKLHKQKDFKQVLISGRKLVHPAILIFTLKRSGTDNAVRLGLVTSRKLGIAAARNRLKRRLREIFRLNKCRFPAGSDIVFMPKTKAAGLNYAQLQSVVLGLLEKV